VAFKRLANNHLLLVRYKSFRGGIHMKRVNRMEEEVRGN
jgi:hypothetical protein